MIDITQPIQQTSSYIQIQPLMAAMKNSNDDLPKNSLPIDSLGTAQSNTHLLPPVTLYNSHGILNKTNPNSLLAYA